MNAPVQALECGVYPDMPEDQYFKLEAVSNSRLTPLLKSPYHCRYFIDHPEPPTAAMTLGSAVDCLVLTPTLFNSRFAVSSQCVAPTQKGQRCSKNGQARFTNGLGTPYWYCTQHFSHSVIPPDNVKVLSKDQSDTAFNMAKSVLNHPGASVLLAACDEIQLSLVWRENNLLCKGRLDGLSTELKTIIDLKKCQDASPEAFSRCIATYGYHRQAAMYLQGATYHSIDVKNYVIIAVEEPPPHAVALYSLTERGNTIFTHVAQLSPVEYGNHQLLRLLDLYERCEAKGEWPSYPASPVPISLPKWAEMSIERE